MSLLLSRVLTGMQSCRKLIRPGRWKSEEGLKVIDGLRAKHLKESVKKGVVLKAAILLSIAPPNKTMDVSSKQRFSYSRRVVSLMLRVIGFAPRHLRR
jgi:hypothetical protein